MKMLEQTLRVMVSREQAAAQYLPVPDQMTAGIFERTALLALERGDIMLSGRYSFRAAELRFLGEAADLVRAQLPKPVQKQLF